MFELRYATVEDVAEGFREIEASSDEAQKCEALLGEAAVMIDAYNEEASADAKKLVSCHIVRRMLGDGENSYSVPLGSTQGSIAAGGYSQSWTYGSSGGAGEMYLTRADKKLLGVSDRIGAYSPLEAMTYD